MSGSPELGEDLVQDTFLRALQNPGILEDLTPTKQRAWLYRTLKNLYLDRWRRGVLEAAYLETLREEPRWDKGIQEIETTLLLQALEPGKLAEKGATFSAGQVIIAQSLVEELIPMIDERAEIVVVPDGTSVVLDDVTLDETTLGRYGKQLYIIGDVTVPEDGGVLGALTYLNIRGDVRVPEAYREQLLGVLTDIGGQVRVAKPRGAVLSDKPFVKITRWMLEQHPQGLEVTDSAIVTLAPDIPRELIADRLSIRDCGMVKCTPEQEDGVNLICEDVGMVGGAGGDPTGGMAGGICKSILQGVQGILDTKVVNAAEYVL